jgi:hypothetical protein
MRVLGALTAFLGYALYLRIYFRLLLEKFKEGYRSGAKVLCADVIHSLKSAADTHLEETENVIHSLVFIGRVADELASSSSFASSIECDGDVMVGMSSAWFPFPSLLLTRQLLNRLSL